MSLFYFYLVLSWVLFVKSHKTESHHKFVFFFHLQKYPWFFWNCLVTFYIDCLFTEEVLEKRTKEITLISQTSNTKIKLKLVLFFMATFFSRIITLLTHQTSRKKQTATTHSLPAVFLPNKGVEAGVNLVFNMCTFAYHCRNVHYNRKT